MEKRLYLVDTCSFVQQFKNPDCAKLMDSLILGGQFVFSAIVAMELYASTKDKQAKRSLDMLGTKLDEVGLLTTPTYNDYQKAGIVLKNYSRRKGSVKSTTHFRDILICLSAIRAHAIIVTENRTDFLRWASEIKRSFNQNIAIFSWLEL